MADGWIPEIYFDEMIPDPRNHPNDWIGSLSDGAPGLLNFDGTQAEMVLIDGALFDFLEYRDCGKGVLTIAADGAWSLDRDMPADANGICIVDAEIFGDKIDAMLIDWKEQAESGWCSPMEPGSYDLAYSYWSDSTSFRFDAGKFVFVRATVMDEIIAERARQMAAEGFDEQHDDAHAAGELAAAALSYLAHTAGTATYRADGAPAGWPFEPGWWKPKDPRRDLIRAGALLLAENSRRFRAGLTGQPPIQPALQDVVTRLMAIDGGK